MIRLAVGQLRRRLGRTVALLFGIAVATTAFTVLTGAATTTQLQARGTVAANFRSNYDLLVRPRSSYTESERTQGLVRPNYQSGIFGGITTAQLAKIRAVPGVEVAAPVANIGYVPVDATVKVPIRPYLTGARQQLFRVGPVWTADRGLSRFTGAPIYVYVSRNPTTVVNSDAYTRGSTLYRGQPTYAEKVPGRSHPVPACTDYMIDLTANAEAVGDFDSSFSYRDAWAIGRPTPIISCFYTDVPSVRLGAPQGAGDWSFLTARVPVSYPMLLAAVDPDAEAQLSGLDRAVVSGRALTEKDRPIGDAQSSSTVLKIPVLAASHLDLDESVSATVERLAPVPGAALTDALTGESGVTARVAALPGTKVATYGPVASSTTYAKVLSDGAAVNGYWTVGSSGYDRQGSALGVRSLPAPKTLFVAGGFAIPLPVGSDDLEFRPVTAHLLDTVQQTKQQTYPFLNVVGQFDRAKVTGPTGLSGLTAEAYASAPLPGADSASRRALADRPLLPGTNLAGYAAQPPALLTTLAGAAPLLSSTLFPGVSAAAPISVIRVRASGIHGFDAVSRVRLDQVATAIAARTGLAVDVVAGASGVPTTVVLPAGEHGRPVLALREQWARKGVAYHVVSAVDRKSVTLFFLILAVCMLVVANAAAAAVRARHTELGVLACLGWRPARLFGIVLTELALTGLLAGVTGSVVAVPLAAALGQHLSVSRAALAIPAAVLLAALAGLLPATRAARAQPMDAVRAVARSPRHARAVRSVTGLALRGLRRVPGRTALGVASLAIGVAAVTVLTGVQHAFHGVVVGSLLGDAVAVQVRTPDVVALAAIMLLGAFGVADVLFLVTRDQAGELAVLQATGWTDAQLSGLVLRQGALIGLGGGLLGAAAGWAALAVFSAAPSTSGLLLPAAAGAAAGVVLGGLAALGPAILARRLPTAALLSEQV